MALQGLVDWRGQPVNGKRHGRVRATVFIHVLIVMANISSVPLILNLVSYLNGTMHMGVKAASTSSTNFYGAICFFSLLGAFVSDSYVKRFYTVLIFTPIEIIGYVLLACQAHFPSLHPPPCDMINHANQCTVVSGRNSSLLTLGLYLVAIGEGSMRVSATALGGDQFDDENPLELLAKISYFNWFTFSISLGGFLGLVFMVWVQDHKGWALNFALGALMMFVGTVVVSCGLPFYRHQKPMGSPLTRILQVFVAAFRKWKLSVPENPMEMHELTDGTGKTVELIKRTSDFKFLDKAAVNDGNKGAWSLCTVTQVEETKIILRMLPIFLSSILAYVSIPLLLALTVQQGGSMNTRLGATSIPAASLFVVPIFFQMVMLVAYDRAIVPWLRRMTGRAGGVTHLQRVGVGFVSSVLALTVAAVVERRRRSMAATAAPLMSVFWLIPQFFLLGVMDVTFFVGLLEFFYSEVSTGMKSIGGAIVFCILGVASWLGSFLIQVVNHATAHRSGGHGWLDGANLNSSRLDLFYWLLAVFGLVSFFLYLICSWRYVYRHDARVEVAALDDNI